MSDKAKTTRQKIAQGEDEFYLGIVITCRVSEKVIEFQTEVTSKILSRENQFS